MKEKVTRKRYSLEFKNAAVSKAKQSGNVSAAARDLGLDPGLLHTWMRGSQKAQSRGMTLEQAKAEQEEIQRLKRENARLKEELEVIKKATAYFSQSQLKKSTPG